ncbi:MAG: hypothetical protein QXO15_05635 [Nitrososphaerota archaeon]
MEPEAKLILLMGIMFAATVVIFSALGEERLDLYVSMFTLEYFISMALHRSFKPKVALYMNIISCFFLIVFSLIVAARVIEILYGVYIWDMLRL